QHDGGVVQLAQREFRHPEQIVPPLAVMDASFVTIVPPRLSHDCRHDPGGDLLDVWQLRLRWMCHRVDDEPGKIGVGYERARRVENCDDPVLTGALRLDEIAEG